MSHHKSSHSNVESQLRKIEELFDNKSENVVKIVESRRSKHCSVHGSHRRGSTCSVKRSTGSVSDLSVRRPSYGSIYNVGREEEMLKRRQNRNSFNELAVRRANSIFPDRRRDSMPVLNTRPNKLIEHPADFPSTLRCSDRSHSTMDLRRPTSRQSGQYRDYTNKRLSLNLEDSHAVKKLHSILKNKATSPSKDSEGSSEQDLCDLTKHLSFDSDSVFRARVRHNSNDSYSSSISRRISIDSLDARRNSFTARRLSDASSLFDDDAFDMDRIRNLNNNNNETGEKYEVI